MSRSLAIVSSAAVAVLGLIAALLSRAIFDRVLPGHNTASLVAVGAAMVVVPVVGLLLTALRSYAVDAACASAEDERARRLFGRLLRGRVADLPSAAAAVAVPGHLEAVRAAAGSAGAFLWGDVVAAVASAVAMWLIVGNMVAVPLACGAIVYGAGLAVRCRHAALLRESATSSSATRLLMRDAVVGARDIRAANAEGRFEGLFGAQAEASAQAAARMRWLVSLTGGVSGAAAQIAQAGAMLWGAWMVLDGSTTVGALIAAGILTGQVMRPVQTVLAAEVTRARAAEAERALAPIEALAAEGDDDRIALPQPVRGAVRFDKVSFRYPGEERLALDGLSLDIAPGEHVALVGPSGSGKSTILALLAGLLDLRGEGCSGAVEVDGLNVNQVRPDSLRSAVGWAPQDPALFGGTIYDNIAMGREVSESDVVGAARVAQADAAIRAKAKGYATRLGEGGTGLSSGERVRVGLARALVANPAVIALDEPTGPLDGDTAAALVQALKERVAGRTLILVTHRPEVLSLVDKILVVEGGRITRVLSPSQVIAPARPQPAVVRNVA